MVVAVLGADQRWLKLPRNHGPRFPSFPAERAQRPHVSSIKLPPNLTFVLRHCLFSATSSSSSRTLLYSPLRPILPHTFTMAPLQDSSVDDLKNTVARLESRIAELESRLGGASAAKPSVTDSVRMILMGPPGAGEWFCNPPAEWDTQVRKPDLC